jgi:arylsulfatase A-like enzyme
MDVVPTVLFAAGLPSRDMEGKILTEAFSDKTAARVRRLASQIYEAERVVVRRSRSAVPGVTQRRRAAS